MRLRTTMFGSAAALGAAALAVTGCSSSTGSTGKTSSPFTVLAELPLSGSGGAQGTAQLQGIKAAAAVLNARGGILGHKISLKANDDQATPSLAITQVQSAVSGSTPNLVLSASTVSDSIVPILNRARVLNIQAADDPTIDNGTKTPYTFCVANSIPSIIGSLVSYVKLSK